MKTKHLKAILDPSVKGNINSVPDRIAAVNRILDAY